MEYNLNTPLNGSIAITAVLHENKALLQNKNLYKFIWVQAGMLVIEVDHVVMRMEENEIIALTPLHHIEIKEVSGKYLSLLFNSNFYCIYGITVTDHILYIHLFLHNSFNMSFVNKLLMSYIK